MKQVYPVKILNARREQIDYTLDQQKALLAVEFFLKSNEQFFLLVGNAGTGKTTIAENIAMYAGANMLAPTNAAVKRLKDKFLCKEIKKDRFSTLHSILYGVPDSDTGEFVKIKSKGKDKDKNKGFSRGGVYIIDEASMIDEQLLLDVMKEVDRTRSKVIFLGDDFQLEPVSKDPYLFKWEKSDYSKFFEEYHRVKLHEVKRNEGSILKVATHLRNNPGVQVLNIEAPDFSIVKQKFSSRIVKDIREDSSYAILVATNKDRIKYNKAVRKVKYGSSADEVILNNEKLISVANNLFPNGEQFIVTSPKIIRTYDKIINVGSKKYPKDKRLKMYLIEHGCKNYRSTFHTLFIPDLDMPSLHSGQLMSCYDIYTDQQLTKTIRGSHRRMWKSNINIATYGYSVSVHKSQGNEWDNIYIDAKWLSDSWNKARWMYTAITRAKKRVELMQSSQFKLIKNE
jgi:ATP-dependent exoDNAse (exonuclease V) alpha subunit